MYTKTRRKKHTDNMEITNGERDSDEDDEENRQIKTSKTRQRRALSTDTHSVFNLSGKNYFFYTIY